MDRIDIHLHATAPEKPAVGAACNGCGVCCSYTPCPLSRALLGHRTGACSALIWQAEQTRYVCGLVVQPGDHLLWLPVFMQGLAQRLATRWISLGSGCDCDATL